MRPFIYHAKRINTNSNKYKVLFVSDRFIVLVKALKVI